MTAAETTSPDLDPRSGLERLRSGVLAVWAAVTGAAPHVLHHVGPLAGSAVIAGAGGRLLFGLAGFLATIPLLRRLRRRTGGWRAPGLALTAFVVVFTVSNLVLGPAIAGGSSGTDDVTTPADTVDVDHHGHDVDAG